MAIFHDFTQVRGAGALIHLPGLSERYALAAELLCFANFSGPTGSFKDSLAEGMIRMAEQSGKLAAAAPGIREPSASAPVHQPAVGSCWESWVQSWCSVPQPTASAAGMIGPHGLPPSRAAGLPITMPMI